MYKIKNLFKEWYQPQDRFVVRNPLFPLEYYFHWKADAGKHALTAKETLRRSLREFYCQPLVQEALYIGSPDLHEQLLLWIEDRIDKPDKKDKLELSLVKYMIRMSTRCTPYGLFASCTAGRITDKTGIELSGNPSLQRFGRLDMDYVCELHSHLLKQKVISDQLRFYPNTSLYRAGDQWRYIEHRFKKETGRSYHLVQVDHSAYLEKVILVARKGCRASQLAETIISDDISPADAIAFIQELIINQVLVNELEPSVTGEEYFSVVLKKLKTLQHTEKYVQRLERVNELFTLLNTDGEKKNTCYTEIVKELQQLEIPLHLKTLIQVDSYRPATCSISGKLSDDLLKGMSLLQLLTPHGALKDPFTEFKTAFINRYEGQWVSLAEVLDTESGIGYGKFANSGMEVSPLIDKLPIGTGATATNEQPPQDTETYKWQLYQQAIRESKTEVVIEDPILETLSKKDLSITGLPGSISMMVKINAATAEDIDIGNYTIALQSPSGPSGGNLLGRFCHLHPDIETLTRSTLEAEEVHHPDAVFAEIVHLPESRIGNILMRPVLRKYEIPYLCGSTLDENFQIPISDLLVGIAEDKVVIRSKRLNKEIIPRMTTAHNFSATTLPVYQFLCDLQFQQIRSIGWQWGALENRPFLPRVRYGKYILSKARWTITKDELKDLDQKNDETLIAQFAEMRRKKNLPAFVLLSQGDNDLLLHLENIFCLRSLMAEVNKNEMVILTESLDTPETCWIKSPEGHHAGELIFTFSRRKTAPVENPPSRSEIHKAINIERFFPVGSEWLYAKIYCGTKTAEKVLVDVIRPFTEALLSKQIIDKYFFLRYHDQGQHIRIRFHKANRADFWKTIINDLYKVLRPYTTNRQVYNVQFETYQREVERYGFDTIHLSEDIFFHQSVSVLNFISLLDGDEGEQYRWQVALKAIDLFLDAFHYTPEQKRDLVKSLDRSFAAEFNIKTAEQKIISERFSTHKQTVQLVMNDDWKQNVVNDSYGEDLERAIAIFQITNEDYIKCIDDILDSPSINKDMQQLNRLMRSYLHMFINRIFISNQRKTELVIYDYLFRYYESKMMRERKATSRAGVLNTGQ
jgi:thiopeptide-type bacteriocin biosynthesis protein